MGSSSRSYGGPLTGRDGAGGRVDVRIAKVIIFVDPRFGAENARHRRPLEAFLRSVLAGRPTDSETECRERLPRCIPSGLVVVVRRLGGRTGGESPHNRFILTDIGGVTFDRGLDDGSDGERDE